MKLWIDNLGCYVDKGVEAWKDPRIRAITSLYKNLRKPSRINWSFGHFLEVIMECAQTAQARGYACFGIEFYGECWGSYNACDTYDRYGNSSRCTQGVGLSWALYVYRAKCGSGNCFSRSYLHAGSNWNKLQRCSIYKLHWYKQVVVKKKKVEKKQLVKAKVVSLSRHYLRL